MMDEGTDALVLLVVITGPLAVVMSTGWQVAWLLALAVLALLRRQGTQWRGLAAPTAPGTP